MTIESVNDEIHLALLEYREINRRHWKETKILNAFNETVSMLTYHVLKPDDEKRCVQLAEKVARLFRFASYLMAVNKTQ